MSMLVYKTGLLSTPFGRVTYEYLYEKYKLRGESLALAKLCKYITPGSLVIDVGANIGVYTNAFMLSVSKEGRVIAIEPDPTNALTLRRRFGQSSQVRVIEAAATDTSGLCRLHRDPYNPAGNVIANQGLEVRSVTIDDLVSESELPLSLIKIDVEGAEPLVIRGAQHAIRKYLPAIYLEYSPERIAEFEPNPQSLLRQLEDLGYEFLIASSDSPQSISRVEQSSQRKGYVDVLMRNRSCR